MILTSKHKRYLRGLAHSLKPVVIIADKGLTDNVMMELETALDAHELIKVKIRNERDTRATIAAEICERTGAELVQSVGQVYVLFRRNLKNIKVDLKLA